MKTTLRLAVLLVAWVALGRTVAWAAPIAPNFVAKVPAVVQVNGLQAISAYADAGSITGYTLSNLPAAGTYGIVAVRQNADGTGNYVTANNTATYSQAQMSSIGFQPVSGFSGVVPSFTYTARQTNGTTSSGSYQIFVGIANVAGDNQTAPPVAYNSGAVALNPLSVTLTNGATITGYRLLTLPSAASGVLYVNGTAATAGQTLTSAQIGQLTFAPATNYSGNASFAYTGYNGTGNGSPGFYSIPVTQAACGQKGTVDFSRRTAGEDWKSNSATFDGTTLTTSGYSTTVTGTNTNTFAVGNNGTLPGPALIWQQNNIGNDPATTPNVSTVTYTFSRPVNGLAITLSDIDKDIINANFIDEITFNGYATTGSTTPIALTAANVAVASSVNQFTGNNTVAGIGTSGSDPAGNVVITFPSAVQKLTLVYKNTAPYVNATTSRTQTVGIPSMTWCSQADVATTLSGPAQAQPGAAVTYTVSTVNNGADAAASVAPTLQLPVGSTVTSLPAGAGYSSSTGLVTFATISTLATGSGNAVTNAVTFTMPATGATVSGTASSTAATEDPAAANNNGTAAAAKVTTAPLTPSCQPSFLDNSNSLSGLTAEYYYTTFYQEAGFNANAITFFQRTAPQRRNDQSLDYTTNTFPTTVFSAGTAANPDNFSARYRGSINIPVTGSYTFYLTSDDASYMWLDNNALATTPSAANAIISNGGPHGASEKTYTTTLTAGLHDILILYAEEGGSNVLKWEYASTDAGIARQVVPASVLCAGPSATNAPPVATNATNATVAVSSGAAVLSPNLLGSDPDGTVAYYNIVSLPATTAGTLRLNGAAVVAGQAILASQLSQLTFTPTAGYSGNATFTYAATDNAGRTGQTAATYTIPVFSVISGTIFEDVNYGGGAGRTYAAANTSATASGFTSGAIRRPNATVELYDANGNFVSSTTTDANGAYSFNVAPATYTVRVVNATVTSSRPGSVAGLLPVQTFVNGATDRVGGEAPEKQDAAANSGNQTLTSLTSGTGATAITPESIASVTASNTGASNIDFGFNFDVVTNTRDAGQGSLRQFILNTNALTNANLTNGTIAGTEYSIFMIPDGSAHPGLRSTLVNQLTNGAAVITLASTLPNIIDAATALDGSTQTTNVGDTNAAVTTDGSESTGPEVTINFNGNNGLSTNAANTRVVGMGFTGSTPGGGSTTAALSVLTGATNAVVQNNTFYRNGANLRINGVGGATFSGNISRNALAAESDGIEMTASSNNTIMNNQFLNNAGFGIDFISGNSNSNTITGNLFKGNGQNTGSGQTAGIGLRDGSSNNTISGNVFTANVGDGISAKGNGGTGNIFSQNSFYANGDLGIDLTASTTSNNGDGVTVNDNGDADAGANGLINFPVITSATIRNGNLLVQGFARPGVTVELYTAAADPTGFGEGQTYLYLFVEGSSADTDASTGTYSGLINGLNQGTDNTNRFAVSIPLSSLNVAQQNAILASGAKLTGLSTLYSAVNGNYGTSEFSGNAPVQNAPVANNDFATTTPGTAYTFSGATAVTANDTPNSTLDPTTVTLGAAVPTSQGVFTVAANGDVTFTPAAGFTGVATIPYTVKNTSGAVSNTAYISVEVKGTTFNLATTVTGPASADAGTPVTYNVTSSNPGSVAATGVMETVQLPAGLATTGFTVGGNSGTLNNGVITFPSGSYNQSSGVLTLNIGNLAATSGSVTTAVTFPASTSNPLTVTANISGNGGTETTTTDNTAVVTTSIAPRFDVTTAILGPTTVTAGNEVTYTILTSNVATSVNANSVSPATNVIQTVTLTGTIAGIYASNGGTVAFNSGTNTTTVSFPAIGTLAAGQSQVNTISFVAPSGSFASPIAVVTSGLTNSNAGDLNSPTVGTNNNTAYLNGAPITSPRPTVTSTTGTGTATNVYTTITSSASSVAPGANITLTINASNAGPAAAAGVQETVALPAGLSFSNLGGGSYDATTGLLTFPALPSSLAIGGTQTYTVTFAAPQQGSVLATATVSTTNSDLVPNDNVVQTKIDVNPVADVATTLAGPAVVLPGQAVNYTVTTANNGVATANGVVQTVQLPAGLAPADVKINGQAATTTQYNAATGVLTLAFAEPLAMGFIQTNTLSFTAPAGMSSYSVVAAVSTSTPETIMANNTATVATSVTPAADVRISATAPASAVVGNQVLYVVSTTNNGLAVATGVVPTLQLPAGLGAANVTFPAGSNTGVYDNTTGLVTFPTVGALASGASLANEVAVTMPDVARLTGVARVTSTSYDTNLDNNYASVATTPATATATTADLRVASLTTAAATVSAGSTATLTATFSNAGTGTATNVVPQLVLVPGLTNVVVTDGGVNRNADYDATTGIVTFQTVASVASGASLPGAYAVTFTAPASGPINAVAAISSATSDGVLTNNTALTTINVTSQANATTSVSGPSSAAPGSKVTYAVTTSNVSTVSPATNVVQTVTVPSTVTGLTYPAGSTVSTVNGITTITFPAIASLASNALVTNYVSFTTPATATSVTVAGTVASDVDVQSTNNSASVTTIANRAPVAYNVVNSLQSPEGITAASALFISPLAATDADGNTLTYKITSLPTTGTLYLADGTTQVTTATVLTAAQAAQLRYLPSAIAGVGNVFFSYTAIDNANVPATSNTALYTIQVGADMNSTYATTPQKGLGTGSVYQNNDVLTYITDINGARYVTSGTTALVYDAATGALLAGASNGLPTSGTNNAVLASDSPYNATSLAGIGVSLNTTTGQLFVSDRTKLVAGTYTVKITTTDVNGGTNTLTETFTIGARPLPVELTRFEVKAANKDALLTWSTASEKNNDHFEVERSFDGRTFVQVGKVAGNGSTSQAHNYSLTDFGVGARYQGTVYYRLKQVDTDGTTQYSPVRTVAFTAEVTAGVALFPNPATTTTTLDLTTLPTGTYQVTLLDMAGRSVLTSSLAGGLQHALTVDTLPAGSYIVVVRSANATYTVRLVKK